jgi:hypothetical protein
VREWLGRRDSAAHTHWFLVVGFERQPRRRSTADVGRDLEPQPAPAAVHFACSDEALALFLSSANAARAAAAKRIAHHVRHGIPGAAARLEKRTQRRAHHERPHPAIGLRCCRWQRQHPCPSRSL